MTNSQPNILLMVFMWFLTGTASVVADLPTLSVPHAAEEITVDGSLADASWAKAAVIQGLKPSLGGKYQAKIDKVPTTIKMLWRKEALYVAFICTDADIYCTETMKHDDNLYKEDVCEVFLDSKGDSRQWVEIQVSPANETLDLMTLLTAPPRSTPTLRLTPEMVSTDRWNFKGYDVKELKTAVTKQFKDGKVTGWTVEMAIPASVIMRRHRKKEIEPISFRANFMRYDHQPNPNGKRKPIHMNWSPVEHGCPHMSPEAMGHVMLEKPLSTRLSF